MRSTERKTLRRLFFLLHLVFECQDESFSGDEAQDYIDDLSHTGVYAVNTAANYDPDIIPYLETPAPCAFEKMDDSHEYQEVDDI